MSFILIFCSNIIRIPSLLFFILIPALLHRHSPSSPIYHFYHLILWCILITVSSLLQFFFFSSSVCMLPIPHLTWPSQVHASVPSLQYVSLPHRTPIILYYLASHPCYLHSPFTLLSNSSSFSFLASECDQTSSLLLSFTSRSLLSLPQNPARSTFLPFPPPPQTAGTIHFLLRRSSLLPVLSFHSFRVLVCLLFVLFYYTFILYFSLFSLLSFPPLCES